VASFAGLVRGGGVGLALIRIFIGSGRFLRIPRVFLLACNLSHVGNTIVELLSERIMYLVLCS